MKKVWIAALVFAVVLAMFIIGCSKKKTIVLEPTAFGSATATPLPSSTPTATATRDTRTPLPTWPAGWIDDCEDQIAPNENEFNLSGPGAHVGGYWITYDDNSIKNNGTSYVWPMSQPWATRKGLTMQAFSMSAPGMPTSEYGTGWAARITGYVCTNASAPPGELSGGYKYGFIGCGTQLTPTAGEVAGGLDVPGGCHEVDISSYTGVKFWVKGDAVASGWAVKVPFTANDRNNCDGTVTDVASSLTGDAEYNYVFTAPATWTQMTISFSRFTQASWGSSVNIADGRYWDGCTDTHIGTTPGWLATCSMTEVLQHTKQIQFQSQGQDVIYPSTREIWIDDIQLYR